VTSSTAGSVLSRDDRDALQFPYAENNVSDSAEPDGEWRVAVSPESTPRGAGLVFIGQG
jgi:hypothetical protein